MLTVQRPICPNSTDPGHVVHTMQHNKGLQRSDYRIKYITTCIYFTSQTSSQQGGPRSDALSRSTRSRSTLRAKVRLFKQNRHMSCHAHLAAQSGSALFRIQNKTYYYLQALHIPDEQQTGWSLIRCHFPQRRI